MTFDYRGDEDVEEPSSFHMSGHQLSVHDLTSIYVIRFFQVRLDDIGVWLCFPFQSKTRKEENVAQENSVAN